MRIPAPNFWPAARTGQRWLLNARRRVTTVDGHRMVYLERGAPDPDRPTVLLIHGFAAMKENWAFWLQRLPRHWHLLVPDVPGLGESDYRKDASYRYVAQALRLRDWLASLPTDNIHLVGSSMGGGHRRRAGARDGPGAQIPDPAQQCRYPRTPRCGPRFAV